MIREKLPYSSSKDSKHGRKHLVRLSDIGNFSSGLDLSGRGSLDLLNLGVADGCRDGLLLLWLDDGDRVGEGLGGTNTAFGVECKHDLNLDTEYTLTEVDVSYGLVDEIACWLTGVDHETVGKLHCLCTGSTELSRDDDLASLCAGLHYESEDTVGGPSDGETTEKLVLQALALGDGGQTTVLDLFGVELDGSLCKLESLLDERGELADPASLLSENLLGVGRPDDDLGTGVGYADLAAAVSLVGELAGEELGQLREKDTICDKLSAL